MYQWQLGNLELFRERLCSQREREKNAANVVVLFVTP